MNRIIERFKQLNKSKEKAFIPFITAGFPSLEITKKLVISFAQTGADVIELGVPFSDPLADGPTIQQASDYALKKGVTVKKILALVKSLRKTTSVPIVLMTYYNPILHYGCDEFLKSCQESFVDGLIIPDLSAEESDEFIKKANKLNICVICFLAPTSDTKRIKYIAKIARGFIYYVSLTGVTGARKKLSADLKQHLKLIKSISKVPVCVGFGISQPEHVKYINKYADGVIVGSAFVKLIAKHKASSKKTLSATKQLMKRLCIKK